MGAMKQEILDLDCVEEFGVVYIDLQYGGNACFGCGKTEQSAWKAARRQLKKLTKIVESKIDS